MIILGGGKWNRERWWYRLVQVCRRWRYLVLESASHLRLSLVCTGGTPVADMLAHSPPLPLIIDHFDRCDDITTEDEEGIILALRHRDRVRCIRLVKPIPILQRIINSLDGEFPNLESLFIVHQRWQRPMMEENTNNTNLKLPETFRAPNLRRLVLRNFDILIGSPLLTTMGNLVALSLTQIPPSAYFHPNALLQRLSLMPQVETLGITFNSYYPSRDVERQLLRAPIMMRVTLPNLRWLAFQGASAYLEALLPWVTIPLLEKLQVYFFNQLTYSMPHLQQFISTAGNFRLKTATLAFREDYLNMRAYPHKGASRYTLTMSIGGKHLDWQVASATHALHALRTALSAVDHLTLKYERDIISSEWNDEADRTQWRKLLGLFGGVKTLFVDGELVGQLSRALQPGEEESSTELLPELQELQEPDRPDEPGKLSDSAIGAPSDAFSSFIDARQKAGHPVALIHP
ncbi:hypothetical protein DFH94DRAFT_276928 [Russula ochroleuca]|uniref:Uncharacterized protein n=1 Tax=Russula ochroleuca TaxID=152965 RepID=A0A9P5JWQ2_9AGAM|nr:hypothetical protein DFH94DRAFT_276928 [Russula ochroleuca]